MNDDNYIITNWLKDINHDIRELRTKIDRATIVMIGLVIFNVALNPTSLSAIEHLFLILHL